MRIGQSVANVVRIEDHVIMILLCLSIHRENFHRVIIHIVYLKWHQNLVKC